jgi:hypothetical protein
MRVFSNFPHVDTATSVGCPPTYFIAPPRRPGVTRAKGHFGDLVKHPANSGTGTLGMTELRNNTPSAPALIAVHAETFLTERQLAQRHQRAPKTLRNDRCRGGYIPYVKIGHHIRYRLSDVIAYEQAHFMTSTSSIQD